jgi:hypothetical protein
MDNNGHDNGFIHAYDTGRPRCLGPSASNGQCPFEPLPGTDYCHRHSGSFEKRRNEEKAKFRYNLGKAQALAEQFAFDPEIKSLRDEIAVSRVLLQELFDRMNVTDNGRDRLTMLMLMPQIQSVLRDIKLLVEAADKMDTKLGNTLDRTQVMVIGQVIVNVVSKYVTDPIALERISEEIGEAMLVPTA